MLAKTPPMGWNTWNTFAHDINESLIREGADAFVDNGLKDAGYEYVVIDDCWSEKKRDSVTNKLLADKNKFPSGMKAVGDYIHSKGLKFGMYSCAGVRTCGEYPGSFGFEYLDAQTFADFGCDFLKYDYCNRPERTDGELLYRRMSMALKATGREILFSACNWGEDEPHKWMRQLGAHMYRSTHDIFDNFTSFKDIALSQIEHLGYSTTGCFNDLDMLTVGMYGKGHVGSLGCNDVEYRTQFALWCLFGSPLMLGCDIRSMTPEVKALVTNKHLIRINQDLEARPPMICDHNFFRDCKIAVKHMTNNEFAFGFFNFMEQEGELHYFLDDMGVPVNSGYGFELTDAFTGEVIGVENEFICPKVQPHDCAVYIGKLVKL